MLKITREALRKGAEGNINSRFMSVLSKTGHENIPVSNIILRAQIRQELKEDKRFNQLLESVRSKGVLQPILVTEGGNKQYLLIAGERRYRAACALGLDTIAARVLHNVTDKDIVEIQLVENIIREDLNCLDEAEGYFKYYIAGVKPPEDSEAAADCQVMINALMTYTRAPERLTSDVADTVSAILKISGKSARTLQRLLTLLRLPQMVKDALREKTISLSIGYTLAGYTDHPGFDEICEKVLTLKITKQEVAALFNAPTGGSAQHRLLIKFRNLCSDVQNNMETLSETETNAIKKEIRAVLRVLDKK
ncbi:MAG: ParB/RepB/Spo0J family partition protein [Nitrospirae bacterium YQR-1]